MKASTLAAVLLTAIAIVRSADPAGRAQKRDEITNRLSEIREWRREAGLPVDPRREDVIATPKTVDHAKHVCPDSHPVPATCGDVCSLAENICDNAEQICILADDLGKDDRWAQDKCASAKASCRDAKKLCCNKCSEPEKKAP